MTPIRIEFDPNVRTRSNGTFVGFEDAPVVLVGERVVLFEPENEIEVDACVNAVDCENGLIHFKVDWSSMRKMNA